MLTATVLKRRVNPQSTRLNSAAPLRRTTAPTDQQRAAPWLAIVIEGEELCSLDSRRGRAWPRSRPVGQVVAATVVAAVTASPAGLASLACGKVRAFFSWNKNSV
jgi:hypothetical protein